MFAKRESINTARVLRLRSETWRQGDALRTTPRRRFDARPAARSMIIRRRDHGELSLTPARWGLVPDWARHEADARPLICVRAEAFAEQIEWRRLLNANRCLVPTDQFFEWKRVAGVKTREYAFKLKNRRPMMIAALWSRASAPSRPAESFAYISCPANQLVGLIHDRMPVILDEAGVSTWLNPDASLENLLALLQPLKHGELELQALARPDAKPIHYQPSLFAGRAA